MYLCIYIYVHIYTHIHIYMHIHTVFHVQRDTMCCWAIKDLPSMRIHRYVHAHAY